MSERSTFSPAGSASPARFHAVGMGCVCLSLLPGLSADAQKWLYRPDWNMMRVTRRGPGVPAEWFSCDVLSQFFYMTFR